MIGSRLSVDMGVRADRGCRHPPLTCDQDINMVDGLMAKKTTRSSPRSRAEAHNIAANCGRIRNLGGREAHQVHT